MFDHHFELTDADREFLRRVRERLDEDAPKAAAPQPPAMQPPAPKPPAVQPPAEKEAEGDKRRKPTLAEQMADLARNAAFAFFHTHDKQTYVVVPLNGCREVLPLSSIEFRLWLCDLAHKATGRAATSKDAATALTQLEIAARHYGAEREVHLRVAGDCQRVFVDLADKERRVVEITPDGWRVITDPPVYFIRPRNMLPLPVPERGGSLDELRPFVNVSGNDDWILLLGWVFCAFHPHGPYPLLAITGDKGSGKSCLARTIRELIDPNKPILRRKLREERDLAIAASANRILAFDNLSSIPVWLSDEMCCLSTGGGFSTRELYENREEVVFEYKNPVMITSIVNVVRKSDLADRAIRLRMPRFPAGARIDETELGESFQRVRARILGAIFDAVAGCLRHWREVPRLDLRMVGAARWAEAGCRTIGLPPGAFLDAYTKNCEDAEEKDALEEFPVIEAIRAVLAQTADGAWWGTATELHKLLKAHADEQFMKTKRWPSNPKVLSEQLGKIEKSLPGVGFAVEFDRMGKPGTKVIRLFSSDFYTSAASAASAVGVSPCEESSYIEIDDSDRASAADTFASALNSNQANDLQQKSAVADAADAPKPQLLRPPPTKNGKPASHSGAVRAWIAPGLSAEDVQTPFDDEL